MGESLAGVLEGVLKRHDISDRILAITTDNASNNNMLTKYLQHALGLGSFCAKHGHLPCLAHVIQLSLKELFGSIRIIPDNEEIMTVWDESSLDIVGLEYRIARILAKVIMFFFFLVYDFTSNYSSNLQFTNCI